MRGVLRDRQKGEKKGRRRRKKRRSAGGEEREKGCGLSPGCWPSHPPFPPLGLPLLPNPSPAASFYTMAASLLKFHVIGSRAWSFVLPQCPGSGACCRGDTLCKLKAGKPFLLSLASEKGRNPPLNLFFSIAPFPPHLYPVSKPKEGCQARSSSTSPLWFVGLPGESLKYHWKNKHKLLIPIRFYRLSSKGKAIARKVEGGTEDGVKSYSSVWPSFTAVISEKVCYFYIFSTTLSFNKTQDASM